jgi:benzodiazapine receptor
MKWLKLLGCLAVSFFVALAGTLVTTPAIPTWYTSLNKPGFSPPNWVFGPVWTVLYVAMAFALYLIITSTGKKNQEKVPSAQTLFFLQLILNFLWSLVFFGFHFILIGLVIIILLWCAILATIINFQNISKIAAYLLYPYLAWVSFAILLNYFVFVLN